LDLQKAFDKVSHEALIITMTKSRWPSCFVNFVKEVYNNNKAFIAVNGLLSNPISVKSGTRQGCPLSPLLFTLIADIFNQNIINEPSFTGVRMGTSTPKKIGAYADDTTVFASNKKDLDIFWDTFACFEEGTAMALNVDKSEAVLLGKWANLPPSNLPAFKVQTQVKYLGCIIGVLSEADRKKVWLEMENKIINSFSKWSLMANAPGDRVTVAKTMVLSKLWYLSSVFPWDDKSLLRIQSAMLDFVWKYKVHKVSRAFTHKSRKEGGLGVWHLPSKVKGLAANWGLRFHTNQMGGSLKATLIHMTSLSYLKSSPLSTAPWWSNNVEVGPEIVRRVGSHTLAWIMNNWNRVAIRRPNLTPGEWVFFAYENGEFHQGVGKVVNVISEDRIAVEWTDFDKPYRTPTLWECDRESLYASTLTIKPKRIGLIQDSELGIMLGNQVISFKELKRTQLIPTQEFGPKFFKGDGNKKLYLSQLRLVSQTAKGGKEKYIKWLNIVSEDKLNVSIRRNWKGYSSSVIQSFRWLLLMHALPTKSRMMQDEDTSCIFCGEEETISHLFHECPFAMYIWQDVINKWNERCCKVLVGLEDSSMPLLSPSIHDFWDLVMLPNKDLHFPEQWSVLQGIVTYHIWRTRCTSLYESVTPPDPKYLSRNIWKHFDWTLEAHISSLEDLKEWWVYKFRDNVFPKEVIENLSELNKAVKTEHLFVGSGKLGFQHLALLRLHISKGSPPDYTNPNWYNILKKPEDLYFI
jgi:hypothetical protein